MLSRRAVLLLAAALAPGGRAVAQTSPLALPSEVSRPIAFSWSGPVEGAIRALAARLGYATWTGTATGLPVPDPAPVVNVSVGVGSASAAEIVEILNRQSRDRAVIVLDPDQRSIGVVYYA